MQFGWPFGVSMIISLLVALSGCAPFSQALLPQPIQLSTDDRVSAETQRQIEQTNQQINQLSLLYQRQRVIPLPLP
jgi:hypothetical protein